MLEIDLAAKFATLWAYIFVFSKIYAKSDLAPKFQPNTTNLGHDIQIVVKTAF